MWKEGTWGDGGGGCWGKWLSASLLDAIREEFVGDLGGGGPPDYGNNEGDRCNNNGGGDNNAYNQ